MNIQLPNGERKVLPNHKNIEERMIEVEELLKTYDEYISTSWETTNVSYFLNGLSNYLVWFKEEDEISKSDKEVLSRRKMTKLSKYDPHNIPFSSLSLEDSIKYGIVETEVN